MDLFVLDDSFRRTSVFDRYESLIWTERYSSYGDFQLTIHSTLDARNSFSPGTHLAINESKRVMTVETVEDKVDNEGRTLLTIKGPSLEDVLNDRTSANVSTPFSPWVITDEPGDTMRYLFEKICVNGDFSSRDIIPFYQGGSLYPTNTISEPLDVIPITIQEKTLYETIKEIGDVYDLGFRLYKGPDTSKLYFDVYSGNDLTTGQTVRPPVVFAPELDNLSDISFLTSTSGYKNVAYVKAQFGAMWVYGPGADSAGSGFDRHVMYVDAKDITDAPGTGLTAKMLQRGNEALAINGTLTAFDGEVTKNSQYKYGRDYELGDIVEIRNADQVTNNMRVTEQIFISDSEGDRSYPTLSMRLLITAGSWYSWTSQGVWDDITDPAIVWATV